MLDIMGDAASDVLANSATHTSTSIEAVALRLRQSVGQSEFPQVCAWAKTELERLADEVGAIGNEAPSEVTPS